MSEFRQDLVSGDWIIVAPERMKRPHDFLSKKKVRKPTSKATCPFEDLQKSGNTPLLAAWPTSKNWRVAVIPNKYPAVKEHGTCAVAYHDGPYHLMGGVGEHELLLTRDHDKNFGDLNPQDALSAFHVLGQRYRKLAEDPCLAYVSTFFNWGPAVGASLFHPHYQILALPIIPPDIAHSLAGSKQYYAVHRECVHCVMIKKERKEKVRIVAENRYAIALAPYASREQFETRIYPKVHDAYFEYSRDAILKDIIALLQTIIKKMRKNLYDPDFNFFIHTSPLKKQSEYQHYHWHIEIIPRFESFGGFELSTGVIINSIDPILATKMIRGEKIHA